MQCIILVAGKGTRMGELTRETPKPMLPLFGVPILAHKIKMLPETIEEVILIVGYKKETIISYFGDVWNGRKITYVEQTDLNGTAGAIHQVKHLILGPFLVLMGDDLYHPKDIERLMHYPLALLAYETNQAEQFGLVTIDGQSNLLNVVERPHNFTEGLVNTGAYILTSDFFNYRPVQISETEYGLPQTLALMCNDASVKVIVTDSWMPIGKPDDLPVAEQYLHTLLNE